MIKTKADLRYYLEQTKAAYGIMPIPFGKGILLRLLFPQDNYEFMINLRKLEYWLCQKGIIAKLMVYFRQWKRARLLVKTGIDLKPFSAAEGLHIVHGRVGVNVNARIGKNCKIVGDVTIGSQSRYDSIGGPIIGERVFVSSGVRIIGNVRIADGVVIGANAVVVKDILEPNTTWAGIPARKISDSGSAPYLREQLRA